MEYISLFPRVIYFYVKLNNVIVMTFKEDDKNDKSDKDYKDYKDYKDNKDYNNDK